MTLRDQLFGFEGRIRRTEWWVRSLLVGVVAAVFHVPFRLLFVNAEDGPFWGETGFYVYQAIGVLITLPFLWIQTAIAVQRGHDLDVPAWPIVTFQIFAVGSSYIPIYELYPAGGPVTVDTAVFAINGLYWTGALIGLVVLGFMPGTRGSNRFGPPATAVEKPAFIEPGGVG